MIDKQYFKILIKDLTEEILDKSLNKSPYNLPRTKDGRWVMVGYSKDTSALEVFKKGYTVLTADEAETELLTSDWPQDTETSDLINLSEPDPFNVDLTYNATTGLTNIATTSEEPLINVETSITKDSIPWLKFARLTQISTTNTTLFRVYADPVIGSNGPQITRSNKAIKSGARLADKAIKSGARLADMDVYKQSTITSNGTLLNTFCLPSSSPTRKFDLDYILDQNKRILITVENDSTNINVNLDIEWTEIIII